MRQLPPLAAIRVFECAARHGNFTRAAEELNMTQAAVSYQIRVLEERIGVALFHRIKRRVELTDIGKRIAPLVSQSFDTLDDAFQVARSDKETLLTISSSKTFSSEWLAFHLGGFQIAHPDIAVRLDTDDRMVDFASSDVDVAIRLTDKPSPALVSHFLMRTPIVPMARPDFLLAHPVSTAAEILALPRLSPDDVCWKVWATSQGLDPPAPAAGGIGLDSQVLDANAAMAGHGVAILNPLMWRSEEERGTLVRVHPSLAYFPLNYWLVYPQHKRKSSKVAAFRSWILAEFERRARDDPEGFYRPAE